MDIANSAVEWAARLVEVLPSRSYRLYYAETLYAARRYDDLLAFCQDIDPIYGERIVELQASALKSLGRISEAADLLASALADHPESKRIAINASALLLADDRPAEAAKILEPRVTSGTTEPGILVNFARSLLTPISPALKSTLLVHSIFLQKRMTCIPTPKLRVKRGWRREERVERGKRDPSLLR